jgi:hypothetical protein
MRRKRRSFLGAAAALSLAAFNAHAGSEVLLEGFEDNIDNVRVSNEGRGAAGNIQLSQASKTAAGETWITEGSKALKVELLNDAMWWGVDFFIQLDAEAGDKLAAAWNANPDTGEKPLARYVLRYDLTFPPSGTVAWMNQAVNNHWEASREWNSPGNDLAPVTVDIELDLAAGDLVRNEDGTVDLRFIDNAQWTEGAGLIPAVYIDNIRLVDQWAAGTPPTLTILESFENGIDTARVTAEGGRTRLAQHTSTGVDDLGVTHGSKSLEVTIGQPEGWADDLKIDLSSFDQLKALLALPAQERSRYIFRMDMLFHDAPEGGWGGGNWGYKFGTSISTADTARTPANSSVYSVNLGKINLDPENPVITLYGNGGYGGEVVTYIDNLRILDTGAAAAAPSGLTITDVSFSKTTRELTIAWGAQAGATYRVHASTDLKTWTVVTDNYPTGGATGNSASIKVPVNDSEKFKFFRVSRIP